MRQDQLAVQFLNRQWHGRRTGCSKIRPQLFRSNSVPRTIATHVELVPGSTGTTLGFGFHGAFRFRARRSPAVWFRGFAHFPTTGPKCQPKSNHTLKNLDEYWHILIFYCFVHLRAPRRDSTDLVLDPLPARPLCTESTDIFLGLFVQ